MSRTAFAAAALLCLLGACERAAPRPQSGSPPGAPAAPAATAPAPAVVTERQKIDALLVRLEASPDRFERNGTGYGGKEAAAHLRSKLESAGARVKTAREFIDGLASTSSISGRPYMVRRSDGSSLTAREWFDAQLAAVEQAAAPAGVQAAPEPTAQAGAAPERVLQLIRSSGVRISIEESDEIETHTAASVANRIAFKYALAGKPVMEADAFITRFCTESSTHGTAYQVVTEKGERPLARWLREKLREAE